MASLKFVLRRNKKKNDNTVPIAIRITQNRKSRFVFTGVYINEGDWIETTSKVKKTHPNSARLNHFLNKKLVEATEEVLKAESGKIVPTAIELKQKVKNSHGASFYSVAEERIRQKVSQGVYSVANAEKSILKNIRRFHKANDLLFSEITYNFIQKFKSFCKSELGQNSSRTITNQLIFIRTVYNQGVKLGVAKREEYPFAGDLEKIRLKRSMKIGLTSEEITQIADIELERGSNIDHARNIFLFSFYFAGIRISDALKMKWSDIRDGRLQYIMNKNEKPVSIKVPKQAAEILEIYRDKDDSEYIFPYLKQADQNNQKDIFVKSRNATKLLNNHLKKIGKLVGIDKNLSNHISRHSFGNIAGDRIHPIMLQKLYRHSDLKTTINYQANFVNKEADDALELVIQGG